MTAPRRRRTYRPAIADKVSGVLASFDGICPVCDEPILARQHRVARRRGVYVHVMCTSGADE